MKNNIPPKLAMINDIAGYGRCSSTVSIPIISVKKVQVCPVPTSIFSNHTGFSTYFFTDYTQHMKDYLQAWEQLSLHFDGIYCGFLSSVNQIGIVEDFVTKQNSLFILDPVLGDHGKTYRTVTKLHCEHMKNLLHKAQIITPNITEACLLTDTAYKETFEEQKIQEILYKLSEMGPDRIVITGIKKENEYLNYVLNQNTFDIVKTPCAGTPRPGTGDIFASIIAADAVKGIPFPQSVISAAEFVRLCIQGANEANIPPAEGVCFENYLEYLL